MKTQACNKRFSNRPSNSEEKKYLVRDRSFRLVTKMQKTAKGRKSNASNSNWRNEREIHIV